MLDSNLGDELFVVWIQYWIKTFMAYDFRGRMELMDQGWIKLKRKENITDAIQIKTKIKWSS
jgi:hypothetical protein